MLQDEMRGSYSRVRGEVVSRLRVWLMRLGHYLRERRVASNPTPPPQTAQEASHQQIGDSSPLLVTLTPGFQLVYDEIFRYFGWVWVSKRRELGTRRFGWGSRRRRCRRRARRKDEQADRHHPGVGITHLQRPENGAHYAGTCHQRLHGCGGRKDSRGAREKNAKNAIGGGERKVGFRILTKRYLREGACVEEKQAMQSNQKRLDDCFRDRAAVSVSYIRRTRRLKNEQTDASPIAARPQRQGIRRHALASCHCLPLRADGLNHTDSCS